jgi:hypothetical protein
VTFETSMFSMSDPIPEAEESICNLGGDLGKWLVAELPKAGLSTSKGLVQELSYWVVIARVKRCDFFVFVQMSPDTTTERPTWLLHLGHADLVCLGKITGRYDRELAALVRALDDCLRGEPRITDVRWHATRPSNAREIASGVETPTA